jgi:predicted transport protein
MSEIKLFSIQSNSAVEIPGSTSGLEKPLQTLFEQNLETLLGVRFLASEHSTGSVHAGRIDTLGIDENGSPVILEYKRSISENVVSQGLYYLDWLMDHKAEFELLVLKRLGTDDAASIDWTGPRLICVATDFTKFDEHAIRQINRNIDLVRFKRFGQELLALELATKVSATPADRSPSTSPSDPRTTVRPPGEGLVQPPDLEKAVVPALLPILDETRRFFRELGDDVTETPKKSYLTYRRLRNFCYLDIRLAKLNLKLKLDPSSVHLREGFSRDLEESGAWKGNTVEVLIDSLATLDEAKPLIQSSYDSQ